MTANLDVSARTRVIEGVGSVVQLGAEACQLGKRVLLVTDAGVVRAGHVERALGILAAAGLEVHCWSETKGNPTTDDVDRCAAVAAEFNPDLFVGFGGGSSIDVAKGANFVWKGGGKLADYRGRGTGKLDLIPLIAVPTTAGTGTEVQSFALIGDPVTHQKMACGHPSAAPRVAILDAALTLSVPAFVTACTGFDTIGHALEVAVTKPGGDISLAFAEEAFGLAVAALPLVLRTPGNVAARADMLRAAALAGRGIENSMLGAAHSMANPLTAHFGVPHGQAVGTMLPLVVAYNQGVKETVQPYRKLALSAGLARADSSPTEVVHGILRALDVLLETAEFPRGLGAHGVTLSDCEALGQEAAEQWTAQFNPRPVGAEEFTQMFRTAVER
ncbi:MAG: alcohol dehydrogenase [Planctomycetota bacterium]